MLPWATRCALSSPIDAIRGAFLDRALGPSRLPALSPARAQPPAANLTVIRAGSAVEAGITGLVRGKFSYLLRGKGRVFGILFRPAGVLRIYGHSTV